MKNLCEYYVYEKLDKARKYTEDAVRDEQNGHTEDAAHMLRQASIQAKAAVKELSREYKEDGNYVVPNSGFDEASAEYQAAKTVYELRKDLEAKRLPDKAIDRACVAVEDELLNNSARDTNLYCKVLDYLSGNENTNRLGGLPDEQQAGYIG